MIPTGMSMDEDSFRSSRLERSRLQCPECGAIHVWSTSDAVFSDKEG